MFLPSFTCAQALISIPRPVEPFILGSRALAQEVESAHEIREEIIKESALTPELQVERATKTIEENPQEVGAYIIRAIAYEQMSRYGDAIDDLTQAKVVTEGLGSDPELTNDFQSDALDYIQSEIDRLQSIQQ